MLADHLTRHLEAALRLVDTRPSVGDELLRRGIVEHLLVCRELLVARLVVHLLRRGSEGDGAVRSAVVHALGALGQAAEVAVHGDRGLRLARGREDVEVDVAVHHLVSPLHDRGADLDPHGRARRHLLGGQPLAQVNVHSTRERVEVGGHPLRRGLRDELRAAAGPEDRGRDRQHQVVRRLLAVPRDGRGALGGGELSVAEVDDRGHGGLLRFAPRQGRGDLLEFTVSGLPNSESSMPQNGRFVNRLPYRCV